MMASGTATLTGFLGNWHAHLYPIVFIGLGTAVSVWLARQLTSPLNKYPGPPLASWTNWYRFYLVWTQKYHLRLKEFLEKYGPVVRIGPNVLDLDYPELIKVIYAPNNKWIKTDFYHVNSIKINGKLFYTTFSTPRNEDNRIMTRPIAKHYSPGAVLGFEPLLDDVMKQLCNELEQRFVKGADGPQAFHLGSWIGYCTWDMVGRSTFSKTFGYMDKGCDFDETIETADKTVAYLANIGQMPMLDSILDKNPITPMGPPGFGSVTQFAFQRIGLRLQGKDTDYDPEVPDYMHHFLEAKKENPELVDDGILLAYLMINLVAGADTIALTIRAIIYFLLKHPEVHEKLKKEIRGAKLSKIAQFKEARPLPYLEAVVRETMRLHPGVALLLERYVPEEGLKLPDGSVVPPGTSVGINAYVVHRNKDIYGPDADEFKPERWLKADWLKADWLKADSESEEAYQERLRVFNRNDFTFGAGPRICSGRHVAITEIYKLVATLLSRFDIELDHPDREWKVICGWFLRQEGLICKVKPCK